MLTPTTPPAATSGSPPTHRDGRTPKVGHTTASLDKLIRLVITTEAIALSPAWTQHTHDRPGIRFLSVLDIEPAITAIAWLTHTTNPFIRRFLALTQKSGRDIAGAAGTDRKVPTIRAAEAATT